MQYQLTLATGFLATGFLGEVNSGLLLAFFTGVGLTSTLFVDTGVCSGVSGFRFGPMGCSLLGDFLNLGV